MDPNLRVDELRGIQETFAGIFELQFVKCCGLVRQYAIGYRSLVLVGSDRRLINRIGRPITFRGTPI